ncbi:ribosomal L27 protein-domain-containing protein [Aspergillus pseudodeflectus]|uniref:Large ribosomal subunit protein bL27m n=1 Tax=Aspergillus pseudodeflectus TaxID=176178 RepID=A0ABR4K0A1_9EURO
MLQPRLLTPLRALGAAITRSSTSITRLVPQQSQTQYLLTRTTSALRPAQSSSVLSNPLLSFSQVRHASHSAQGAANKHSRDPAGKRLGAKRTGGEYVVPGCIIFRQRGTKWFPGENCAMGRDHTIYAAEAGYVRYYLDPARHPDRKYIGVVFEKDGKLPTPQNAPTRRKLNRIAVPRLPDAGVEGQSDLTVLVSEETGSMVGSAPAVNAQEGKQLRPGYMWREANWSIGRAAEKAGITAAPYDRNDRWLAWRKRQAKVQRAIQMKSLKNKKKASKKAKK